MAQSPLYGKAFDRQSQYRDRLAAQLLAEGSDASPVQHWTQGAARLAQALAGGLIGQKQDERYAEREKQSAEAMANLFAPSQQFTPSAAGAGPRPGAQMQTVQPTLAELAQRAAAHPATQHLAPQFQMQDIQNQQQLAQRGTWKAAEQNGLKGQVNSATGEFKPDPLPRNPTGPQGLVAEYEYAKGQGFKGSILDYQTAKGAAGRAPEAPAGQQQPFAGTGMPAQIANILLDQNIPPTDPRYHWAYAQATAPQERFDPALNQVVTIRPQIPPTIRQPVYPNQGAPQAQPVGQTPDAGMGPGGQAMPSIPSPQTPAQPPQANAPQQITPTMSVQQIGDPKPKDFTESQAKANMFGTLMEKGHNEIDSLKVPSAAAILAWRNLPEGAVNMGLPENDQKYFNSLRTFAAGILRKETGASFGKGELEDVQSRFFPMPGDTPNVIAQKAASRAQAIASMKAELPGGQFRGVVAPSAQAQGGGIKFLGFE